MAEEVGTGAGAELRFNRRGIFKYGYDAELMESPMRFGPGFTRPRKKTVRLERAKKGPRMFEAEEVQKLVNGATVEDHGR